MDSGDKYLCMTVMVLVLFFMLFHKASVTEGMTSVVGTAHKGYGMWCANQNCLNAEFVPQGLSRIYVGDFAQDADGLPKKAGGGQLIMDGTDLNNIKSSTKTTPIVYVTLAGENATAATAEGLVRLYKGGFEFDGLDFDMEGDLGSGDPGHLIQDKCMGIVNAVSAQIGKSLYVQFTVLAGDKPEGVGRWALPYKEMRDKPGMDKNVKQFNLALMLYGDSMTSSGWGCANRNTFKYLDQWMSDVSMASYKGEIILGMTPIGMEHDNGECFMKEFREYVDKNGLYGINFWQPITGPCTVCQMMTDESTFPGLKNLLGTAEGVFPALTCEKNSCPPPPRCGTSWSDANSNCKPVCVSHEDCPSSDHDCYGGMNEACPGGASNAIPQPTGVKAETAVVSQIVTGPGQSGPSQGPGATGGSQIAKGGHTHDGSKATGGQHSHGGTQAKGDSNTVSTVMPSDSFEMKLYFHKYD